MFLAPYESHESIFANYYPSSYNLGHHDSFIQTQNFHFDHLNLVFDQREEKNLVPEIDFHINDQDDYRPRQDVEFKEQIAESKQNLVHIVPASEKEIISTPTFSQTKTEHGASSLLINQSKRGECVATNAFYKNFDQKKSVQAMRFEDKDSSLLSLSDGETNSCSKQLEHKNLYA